MIASRVSAAHERCSHGGVRVHFPRYWAKATDRAEDSSGEDIELACWRWSDVSLAEAQELALEAARALVQTFVTTGRPPDKYGYSDRPLREPVLREIKGSDGAVVAAVTRNAQGCEVLNTTSAMFIDIDFDAQGAPSLFRRVIQLFRSEQPEVPGLARAQSFLNDHPGWGMRVYRTAAGLRILVTHAPIDSDSELADEVLREMCADPLYRRLCAVQKSYRARLTPKHWRCDAEEPPTAWPFEDDRKEEAFERWEQGYRDKSRGHAVCKLIHKLGSTTVHPEIQPIIELHDEATRVDSDLPLA